jgi:hyaluronan synthase
MRVPTDWLYYLPIGIIGVIRWGTWIVRRIPAALYRPVINEFRLPLSVVVPVYQEDPDIFAKAISSWLANDVAEVILVIDSSDTVCQEVAARFPVTVLVTDVPGKRDALRRGWEYASTPLVALVDSDTVWALDVTKHVCMPFADPQVGGVATRQNVYNPVGFLQRVNDMYLDYRYFDENAAQTAAGQAISCISGRTGIYRRELLLEISDDFMGETFLGVPCMSGDDKRLTSLLLARGHKTVLQRTARVWSTFPGTMKVFFRQRLRWSRNTWRSDLRATVIEGWVWRHKFLAFTMIDKGISSFTLLLAPIFMILAIIRQDWIFVALLAGWWWLSRSIKLLPHLRRRWSSVFLVPPFVLLTFAMAIVKIAALLTVRKQRWLTRDVEVVDGHVVRTNEAARAGVPVMAGGPVLLDPAALGGDPGMRPGIHPGIDAVMDRVSPPARAKANSGALLEGGLLRQDPGDLFHSRPHGSDLQREVNPTPDQVIDLLRPSPRDDAGKRKDKP